MIEQFGPAMVLVSVGVDAHDRDPLASMTLSSEGLVEQVERLRALAGRLCERRLAMALEGGYDVDALAEVITGIVARARGGQTTYRFTESHDTQGLGRRHVDAVIESVKPYWEPDRV